MIRDIALTLEDFLASLPEVKASLSDETAESYEKFEENAGKIRLSYVE